MASGPHSVRKAAFFEPGWRFCVTEEQFCEHLNGDAEAHAPGCNQYEASLVATSFGAADLIHSANTVL